MALTLSHQSALDVIRQLRSEGSNLHEMDITAFAEPSVLVGKRWDLPNFTSDMWRWQRPTPQRPLHVLVPTERHRPRGVHIRGHLLSSGLPAGSIIWLDEYSSVVCPELLFLQMAGTLPLPALVMLGHELCGHFSRNANEPLLGVVTDGIPAATSVFDLERYLLNFKGLRGLARARKALHYVCDHAISAPEAVLATMYTLPPAESGYGMGPVVLNDRVEVDDDGEWVRAKSRYPDLSFVFAPVGINYDGSKHFDVNELMAFANRFARADAKEQHEARDALRDKLVEARAKILDDNMRNRQLAAQGKIILSATKEDLASGKSLDVMTRQILSCARRVFGVEVGSYMETLDNTLLARDRWELLSSLLPTGHRGKSSYGKM